MKRLMFLCLASIGVAGACSDDRGADDETFGEAAMAEAGDPSTPLRVDQTARGFSEREVVYDWTIDAAADAAGITVAAGETGSVHHTLCATRTAVSTTSASGVRGQICVSNDSDVATEGLTIVEQVQCQAECGQLVDVPGASQVITSPQLRAYERRCFDYEIPFIAEAGATCRNTAAVTLTNFVGHAEAPRGPVAVADFSMPSAPIVLETDATASVNHVETCPAGFTCTPDQTGPFSFSDDGCVEITTTLCNDSAACDAQATLCSEATLTESCSGETRTGSTSVDISTGSTPTIVFWEGHTGSERGEQADDASPLPPIWLGARRASRAVPLPPPLPPVGAP